MTIEIKLAEDLWEEDAEAVVTSWLVSDGSNVDEGDLIAEIMVEKLQIEVAAPASGTVKIISDVDDVVTKGDVIGTIS